MGISPSEFWKLTLKEFDVFCDAYSQTRTEQMDYDISLQWYNAAFQRQPKLPKLSKLLINKPVQTEQEMLNNMLKAVGRK